jgi:hypothetical protein
MPNIPTPRPLMTQETALMSALSYAALRDEQDTKNTVTYDATGAMINAGATDSGLKGGICTTTDGRGAYHLAGNNNATDGANSAPPLHGDSSSIALLSVMGISLQRGEQISRNDDEPPSVGADGEIIDKAALLRQKQALSRLPKIIAPFDLLTDMKRYKKELTK